MNSKYKVGDVVRVKSHYDKGMGERDYPFVFTDEMLEKAGGKSFKIAQVRSSDDGLTNVLGDPYCYILEMGDEFFNWHSSMFENTKGIKSHRRHHAHLNTHI